MDFIDNIELPAAKVKELTSYKSFGDAWVKRAMRSSKARIYIEQNLKLVKQNSSSCGRCCSEGTLTYCRLDDGDITDQDVTALLLIDRGQENRVQKRTPKDVTIYWLCDSSD
jgi:hypothetical protein